MKKEIINELKELAIDILIMSGMFYWLKIFWDNLELTFDGGIQVSISDSIIAVILVWLVWSRVKDWIQIKSEVEQ